jgi:hypothetical protein
MTRLRATCLALLTAAGTFSIAEAPEAAHPLALILYGSALVGLAAGGAAWAADIKKKTWSHKLVAKPNVNVKKTITVSHLGRTGFRARAILDNV